MCACMSHLCVCACCTCMRHRSAKQSWKQHLCQAPGSHCDIIYCADISHANSICYQLSSLSNNHFSHVGSCDITYYLEISTFRWLNIKWCFLGKMTSVHSMEERRSHVTLKVISQAQMDAADEWDKLDRHKRNSSIFSYMQTRQTQKHIKYFTNTEMRNKWVVTYKSRVQFLDNLSYSRKAWWWDRTLANSQQVFSLKFMECSKSINFTIIRPFDKPFPK